MSERARQLVLVVAWCAATTLAAAQETWVPDEPPTGASRQLAVVRDLAPGFLADAAPEEVRAMQRHLFFLDGVFRSAGEPADKPVTVALLKGVWNVARQALATSPAGPVTDWQKGLLAYADARYGEAATLFGGLATQPGEWGNTARLWAGWAQIHAHTHPGTALRDLVARRLQRLGGTPAPTGDELIDLLWACHHLGDEDQVGRLADRIYPTLPGDPRLLFVYALSLVRQERFEEARGALVQAIDRGAGHPQVSKTFVAVCLQLGRAEEAYREQVAADALWGTAPLPASAGIDWYQVTPAQILQRGGIDRPTDRAEAARQLLAKVTGPAAALAHEALGDLALAEGFGQSGSTQASGADSGAVPQPTGVAPPSPVGESAGQGMSDASPDKAFPRGKPEGQPDPARPSQRQAGDGVSPSVPRPGNQPGPGASPRITAPAGRGSGSMVNAIDQYRQALAADPLAMTARVKLTLALLDQGKFGPAFDEYLQTTVWTLLPHGFHALARLRASSPQVFQALGNLFALSLYGALRDAAADATDPAPLRTAAAVAFSLFHFDRAVTFSRQALQRGAADPALTWLHGLARYREAEYGRRPLKDPDARAILTALTPLADQETGPLADVVCARLQELLKRPDLARLHWQRALARQAEDPTVLHTVARLARADGDEAKARDLLERLFRREYTTSSAAIARRAWLSLARDGAPQEADR